MLRCSINVLENMYSWQFSKENSIEMLVLRSRIFRTMDLPDKAIAILQDKAEYIDEPELKARLYFELAECFIIKDDLDSAYNMLTEVVSIAKAGSLTHEAACLLADVCLKLNNNIMAASVCRHLLKLEPPEQVKNRALELLATAYSRQKDMDSAVLALMGQWK